MGTTKPCKICKSENLRMFHGELTATFAGVKNVEAAPVYVSRKVTVCLECGFAELMIPPRELGLLKKGNSKRDS